MAQAIWFGPLGPQHAARLASLAGALGGGSAPAAQLCAGFAEALRSGADRSSGLFDRGRLVGYLLAHVRPCGLRATAGPVLEVAALGVRPAYRWALAEFIGRWRDSLGRSALLPLEAYARARDVARWRGARAPLAAELGYPLAAHASLGVLEGGAERFWLRWEPRPPCADPRALALLESHAIGEQRVDVRAVRSELAWERLEPHWNALLEATPGAAAYQSFEYLRAWWRCFGGERRLLILSFWRGSELLGIAPLCARVRRGAAGGWVRELAFIGGPLEGAPSFVDRPVMLFGEAHVELCTAALARSLASAAADWDAIDLHEQAPDGPAARALEQVARARARLCASAPDAASAYVQLAGSYDALLASRAGHFRRTLRAAVRRLEAHGPLRCERHCGFPSAAGALERYRELEQRSWKRGHGAAVGSGPRRALYDALCAALAPKGSFQVSILFAGERPVAAALALVHGRGFHGLEITYDAEFARGSPGTVLQSLEFERAFALGCEELDLRAGQLAYKHNWGPQLRETRRLRVTRATPRLWFDHALELQLRPALKALVRRVRALRAGEAR